MFAFLPGAKISMTAPVVVAPGSASTMQFIMPKEYKTIRYVPHLDLCSCDVLSLETLVAIMFSCILFFRTTPRFLFQGFSRTYAMRAPSRHLDFRTSGYVGAEHERRTRLLHFPTPSSPTYPRTHHISAVFVVALRCTSSAAAATFRFRQIAE